MGGLFVISSHLPGQVNVTTAVHSSESLADVHAVIKSCCDLEQDNRIVMVYSMRIRVVVVVVVV